MLVGYLEDCLYFFRRVRARVLSVTKEVAMAWVEGADHNLAETSNPSSNKEGIRVTEVGQRLADYDVLLANGSSELIEDTGEACLVVAGGEGTRPRLTSSKRMAMMRLKLWRFVPLNHFFLPV